MLAQLNTENWQHAFRIASVTHPMALSSRTNENKFGVEDVHRIFGISEGGFGSERPWLCCGRLKDGRCFALRSFLTVDVQGSTNVKGQCIVTSTREEIIARGMSNAEATRMHIRKQEAEASLAQGAPKRLRSIG